MTDFILSLIRTVVPIIVGSVVGWLGARGIDVEPEAVGALTAGIGALAGAIYYAAARWLEQRWPILGHLLGPAQAPVYPDSRETHDIVRNAFDLDRRHDDGSGDG